MIKLSILMIFFFAGPYSLEAADVPGGDQEFTAKLDNIKNPFEDGLPKPIVIPKEPAHNNEPESVVSPKPKPEPVVPPVISLPALNVQGVIVGEDIHQAIINDQVVPLLGTINGARVDSVTKQGVGLFYKGKKFFLKVD